MPPKKENKKVNKKNFSDSNKEQEKDFRDNLFDYEIQAEYEILIKEKESIKNRIEKLKKDNYWLEEEAQTINDETQEYMSFMAKKANLRQNSIITLTEHNVNEIQILKAEREDVLKAFEKKKLALQTNFIDKGNLLKKIKDEIYDMSEYIDLKEKQLNEINELETYISNSRKEQTKMISDLRTQILEEKASQRKETEVRIAGIIKTANMEAKICLSENTYKIIDENQKLRQELIKIINESKNFNNHKNKLEKQRNYLLREIKYIEDLKKVRSTQQQRVIDRLIPYKSLSIIKKTTTD